MLVNFFSSTSLFIYNINQYNTKVIQKIIIIARGKEFQKVLAVYVPPTLGLSFYFIVVPIEVKFASLLGLHKTTRFKMKTRRLHKTQNHPFHKRLNKLDTVNYCIFQNLISFLLNKL